MYVDGSMYCLKGGLGGKEIRCIARNCNFSFARFPRRHRLRFLDHLAVEMADKKERQISSFAIDKEKEKIDEKKEEEEEETPPEKPEPGDCCGSGCVRCVWDVYYDELEQYNKRQNQKKKG